MWIERRYLIIAVIAGVVVSCALFVYLSALSEKQTVVVASKYIPSYEPITADMVSTEEIPAGAVLPSAVSDSNSILGRYLTRSFHQGEQILNKELVQAGTQTEGLAWQLAKDERAMAVPCSVDSAVGGAVSEGHLVDLLHFRESSVHGPATGKLFLDGLQVLDVRDSGGQGWNSGDRNQLSTVVVAVTTSQAEMLTYALSTGEIRVALSPYNPEPAVWGPGVTGDNLFSYLYDKPDDELESGWYEEQDGEGENEHE